MAAQAHTTAAPSAPPTAANDNPPGQPCDWHRIIKLFTSWGDDLGICAWNARKSGQTAPGFVEEVIAADAALQAAKGKR